MTIDQLNQQLNSDKEMLVLDVRSKSDYRGELGHIAGSQNIPLEKMPSQLDELTPWLEKPITIVCTTDQRSKKAARMLAGKGFADVHVVTGGMKQWNQEGLSVERS